MTFVDHLLATGTAFITTTARNWRRLRHFLGVQFDPQRHPR